MSGGPSTRDRLEAWYVDRVRALAPGSDLQGGLSRAKAAEAAGLAAGALAGGGLAVIDLAVPFAVSAAICAAMIVAVVAWVHEPAPPARIAPRDVLRGVPATMWTGIGTALGHRTVRRITVLSAGLGVALVTVELLAPVSLADIVGSDDEAAGTYAVLLTIGFLGSAGGSALAPFAARLTGSPAAAIVIGRVLAAAALLGLATSSFAVTAVAFVAFYTVLGVTQAADQPGAPRRRRVDRAGDGALGPIVDDATGRGGRLPHRSAAWPSRCRSPPASPSPPSPSPRRSPSACRRGGPASRPLPEPAHR